MAGNWRSELKQAEIREEAERYIKEQSKQHNEDAFKPDSEKKADVNYLMLYETLESIYETICFNVIAEAGSRMFQPLVNAARKKLSKFFPRSLLISL